MKRTFLLSTLFSAIPAFAQTPTATTLPANVQADIAVVQQDRAALRAAFQQMRSDESANAAAVPADRTALALARLQLRMDTGRLHMDAAPILQADATALQAALTKLHGDQVSNDTAALPADDAAVQQARSQMMADAKSLHLGGGHGHHRHHG
ncbi:MAG TPA: hypothetical protein VH301_12095 [Usitatibacter sp.]|jgi:hypothetical protein|nr:hypothetical protein [Usitatibacter sp.]